MTRVLIDNIAYSIQKIGGISSVFYELTTRLIKDSRYQTEFIECEDACENYYRSLLDLSASRVKSFARKWFKLLRYINPKPGIDEPYIFHSSYYRTSRDSSAVNVTTVHDFEYELNSKKKLKSYVHIWQKRKAVRNSDLIICISENTKRDLLHCYKDIDEKKVHVVYNGVSDEFHKLDNIDNDRLPFAKGTYCIYIGVRKKYKNFELAIDSISQSKYNIVLVGPPLTSQEKAFLDSRIGSHRYASFSRVATSKLNELYNGAFALLYLSSFEGFGIPCLEAQKAGCPVIACNTSSLPEVVCNKELLCPQPLVGEVCNRIARLEEPCYRETIINQGILFAKQFSWQRTYSQLTQLYDQAIAQAKGNSNH